MTDFPFDIVGFDLDGTLVDTSQDIAAAANYGLAQVGRAPLSLDQVRPMIGGGAGILLRRALEVTGGVDERLLEQALAALSEYYQANICVHSVPFPGLVAALDALAAMDVKLAVATNKRVLFARKLIDTLGWSQRFDVIIGGDTLGPGKAKPDPAMIHEMIACCGGGRAAFVGDSNFDVAAARAAGVPSIACSFGFSTEPADQLGADAVIDHFDELIGALRRVG